MDKDDSLPFEVEQLCEARSFQHGFRGAWFRCKIKQIMWKKGYIHHLLEYFDFPDEKRWTKLYQVPFSRKKDDPKRQLMVRPQYPAIYLESQIPPVNSISEVIVVTTGAWNVGDLVDWWKDDCYWSGRITQVMGNGKAEMEFPPPPIGEGSSYEVSFQDLRPSLDWSPEDGWRVSASLVSGSCHQCARLIHPVNQAGGLGFQSPSLGRTSDGHVQLPSLGRTSDGQVQLPSLGRTSDGHVAHPLPSAPSFSSYVPLETSAASDKTFGTSEMLKEPLSLTGKTGREMNLVPEDNGSEKKMLAENNSSLHVTDGSDKTVGHIVDEDLPDSSCPLKKLKTSQGNSLNSLHSVTLEAAVLNLEVLANKIKRLKELLVVKSPLSNAMQHSWRFVEHRAPSMPK